MSAFRTVWAALVGLYEETLVLLVGNVAALALNLPIGVLVFVLVTLTSIFFGLPIVLNPIFMIPYILSALILTTGTYLLMYFNVIHRPFVNIPWTTPPIIGQYLVSGGDWKAAVWGAISIVIAMLIYLPFAKAAERQRLNAEAKPAALCEEPTNAAI